MGSPSVLPVAISRVTAVRCQPEPIQRPTQPEVQNDLSPRVPSLAWAGHSALSFPLCPSPSACGELGFLTVRKCQGGQTPYTVAGFPQHLCSERPEQTLQHFLWSGLSVMSGTLSWSKVSHRASPGPSGGAALGGVVHGGPFWGTIYRTHHKDVIVKSQPILKQRMGLPMYHSFHMSHGDFPYPSCG